MRFTSKFVLLENLLHQLMELLNKKGKYLVEIAKGMSGNCQLLFDCLATGVLPHVISDKCSITSGTGPVIAGISVRMNGLCISVYFCTCEMPRLSKITDVYTTYPYLSTS